MFARVSQPGDPDGRWQQDLLSRCVAGGFVAAYCHSPPQQQRYLLPASPPGELYTDKVGFSIAFEDLSL